MTARSSRTRPGAAPTQTRRRPADRREQILATAAAAFSAEGFHAVRLSQIAADVGISTPALYRHFANKYDLFAESTRRLAVPLREAIDGTPEDPDPQVELADLLSRLALAAVEHRRTGGIYRWETRFLEPDDAAIIRAVVIDQHRRVRSNLWRLRPELSKADADLLTVAMISVVASPTTHRSTVPRNGLVRLIVRLALSLSDLTLPRSSGTSRPARGLAPAGKREQLLAEAIRLFAARGFHDVTVEDIATAAGMPASGVYRHFDSKPAILTEAFWRAADRTTVAISDALATATTPTDAIDRLIGEYVRLSLASTDLVTVYMTELGNVSREQRSRLRNRQRLNIDEWSAWVEQARPDLSAAEARIRVHATLNVVGDLCRVNPRPAAERICAAAVALLLGPEPADGPPSSHDVETAEQPAIALPDQ